VLIVKQVPNLDDVERGSALSATSCKRVVTRYTEVSD